MSLLADINSPSDLKIMDIKTLSMLAQEIREKIVKVVSKNGGHLAPSLGAVDFTVALYYCLNMPKDIVVWDVGHQAYSHKILTGRRDLFESLRQKGGISGFPNINESIYDQFTVGHGSNSISTALGICAARDLNNEDNKVVAVIGDGSLGGGLAFEGLNHAGQLKKDFLIILNDNEFSISPSVGAFSRYLNKIITNPLYNRIKEDLDKFLNKVPKVGRGISKATKRLEDSFKAFLVPGMLFEDMGIRYFGPVDGHNIDAMVDVFKNVIPLKEPRIIHLVTKKGKGYKFSEENPKKFHGTAPFNIDTGEPVFSSAQTFTSVFGQKIAAMAEKNEKIVAVTAAMPDGTGLDLFAELYPQRFYNVGMAEEHAVSFSAGLAKKGFIPIVAIYSTFLQRAYDQIIHDVCLQGFHVVFCLDRSGIVGEDGPTHNGIFDISYLRHIPNLALIAPSDMKELEQMLDYAVDYNGPIAIRYPRGAELKNNLVDENNADLDHKNLEFAKSEILRTGKDIAIFAAGDMVYPSLAAARILASDGISAEVINARFLKPIDVQTISNICKRISKILVVEDNVLQGGFGSAIIEVINDAAISKSVRLKRLGIEDKFLEHGKREVLLNDCGLSSEKIAFAAMALCEKVLSV